MVGILEVGVQTDDIAEMGSCDDAIKLGGHSYKTDSGFESKLFLFIIATNIKQLLT